MKTAPLPLDEAQRLDALRRYAILDTPPEAAFDDMTRLASRICGTPFALVSLVDAERVWFKARLGIAEKEAPRAGSFCAHVLVADGVLEVADALVDERFAGHPMVMGGPRLRFYAGAPLVTHDGHCLGALCVLDTVPRSLGAEHAEALAALSRQVMAQLELRHTVTRLAASVRELTGAHDEIRQANARLERARDEAEKASRARGAFIAHISHEIRTPLNAIIGLGDLLLRDVRDQGDTELGANLETIMSAGEQMLQLVNQLLDLAKIDAGRMELAIDVIDVRSLVSAVSETVRPLALKRHNRLEVRCAEGVGAMGSDATRIRQILLNLLSNACKFTERGVVSLDAEPDGEGWVILRVRDTGIGMSPAELERVFDEFAQAGRTRAEGTGLGLALARKLCMLLGGSIAAESEPGRGSTFTVRLPRRPARA